MLWEPCKMGTGRVCWLFAAAFLLVLAAPAFSAPLAGPPGDWTAPPGDAEPRGVSYMLMDHWGGTWYDAEKRQAHSSDDMLCWAAAASNVLKWGGWADAPGMQFPSSNEILGYYADHWSNTGGLMEYAWDWWFDGTNPAQGWPGWSQVVDPGGGFYPERSFSSYYHRSWVQDSALSAIDEFLHDGCGVTVAIYGGGAHALTVWGYAYDAGNPQSYYGIWVTDSDDDKSDPNRVDRLRYYDIAYNSGRYYLQNYSGTSNLWYLSDVEALAPVPEPTAIAILLFGSAVLLRKRRA
jgi:hypothetical protein